MSPKTTRIAAATAAASVLAVVSAAATASPSSVTITSPKTGSTLALHSNPYTAVAGGVTFSAATPQTTRFYRRRDGCGTSSDNPHLSTSSGTDGGDGCGLVFNAVVGLGGDVDQNAFIDFPSTDGMPVALDTGRAITGVLDFEGNAAGLTQVDVSMEALVGGQGVTVGSDSESVLLDPTASSTSVPFTIQPSTSLAGADLQGIDLRVRVHGPSIDAGFIGLSGKSWTDVPAFTASVNKSVSISVDDPTFANPVPARVSGSSWSVAIPTPAVGKHTVYAHSAQGFDTSAPAATTFTVKR